MTRDAAGPGRRREDHDIACEELARKFLPERWSTTTPIQRERAVQELAQRIQDTIEDWIDEH